MSDKVCVFAGQGAQVPGMGKDFAADPEIAAMFTHANEILGFDVAKLCFEGPAEELTKSNVCQPAIFLVSVAAYKAYLKKFPGASFLMAGGLSLGEWTALHVAGVLPFDAALRVLEARGRYMQEACEEKPSGMVSVMGATAAQIQELCEKNHLTISNLNSESQVVISGAKEDVAAAASAASSMGVKAIVLHVAGAFHSPFMGSARAKLAEVLKSVSFQKPRFPVLSNVTGKLHSNDPDEIKAAMLRQVTESVRWCDDIRTAVAAGGKSFVEFGPGHVLSSLIKRIDKTVATANVSDVATLNAIQ